tara:strand:+ start:610 stop:867 length:258 start_codon:yes stop_codon:yes gene_type:complete
MTRNTEDVDLEDNDFRVFTTNKTMEALIEEAPYGRGIHYFVTVGRMSSGKYNVYFANAFTEGANISYRVYDTIEDLLTKFKEVEI